MEDEFFRPTTLTQTRSGKKLKLHQPHPASQAIARNYASIAANVVR
jgi:hypothetical protein